MITEDYVSFEVAKLLKEKGFDEPVTELNKLLFKEGEKPVLKITHQKAMKWLREVHNIFIELKMSKNTFLWGYRVSISNGSTVCFYANIFNKYEEAAEAAIKCCLENLI